MPGFCSSVFALAGRALRPAFAVLTGHVFAIYAAAFFDFYFFRHIMCNLNFSILNLAETGISEGKNPQKSKILPIKALCG